MAPPLLLEHKMKVMSDAELSCLLKELESDRVERRRPFNNQSISSATLDDIDRLRFEQEYLPVLVAKDGLASVSGSSRARSGAADP